MKRLVAVLLCMTMAVSITACGNSETENNKVAGTEAGDKPESISVICTTDEEGLYEYAGKKYEEMYGVKVNLICQSYDSTHEKNYYNMDRWRRCGCLLCRYSLGCRI